MRRNKFVFVFLVVIFTGFITSWSFAQPRIDRGIRPEPGVTVPDDPRIEEFAIEPQAVTQEGSVNFRWRVAPGPGGSPITSVRITVGAIELHRSSSASGEARVNLPAILEPGPASLIHLTATNQIRRSSISATNCEVKSIDSIKRDLILLASRMDPAEVREGEPLHFILAFDNRSGVTLSGVQICFFQTANGRLEGNVLAALTGQTIRPGRNDFRLRLGGLRREYGDQLKFRFMYRDQDILVGGVGLRTQTHTYFSLP
jgi:hypothetical protein